MLMEKINYIVAQYIITKGPTYLILLKEEINIFS